MSMIEFCKSMDYNNPIKITCFFYKFIVILMVNFLLKEDLLMVHIISGEKGKGKTKVILNKANEVVQSSVGNVVFLDKDASHMYELDTKIRLINVKDFMVESPGEFVGFICGILSQDHDLESIFLDSFLKISLTDVNSMTSVLDRLITISEKFDIDVFISLSVRSSEVPEKYKDNVMVSL